MHAFIWRRVEDVTTSWHSEGGVLVVAADGDAAREAVDRHRTETAVARYDENETPDPVGEPDLVLDLVPGSALPSLMVFPDAGCC